MDLKQRFASVAIVGALAFTGAFAAMPVFAQDGEPAAEASEATPQVTDQVATQADTAIEVQLYALSSCSICGKSHSVFRSRAAIRPLPTITSSLPRTFSVRTPACRSMCRMWSRRGIASSPI